MMEWCNSKYFDINMFFNETYCVLVYIADTSLKVRNFAVF